LSKIGSILPQNALGGHTVGQVIARYVDDAKLHVLERLAKQKCQGAGEIGDAARVGERSFRLERRGPETQMNAARAKVSTPEFLVERDAEPRVRLEEVRLRIKEL